MIISCGVFTYIISTTGEVLSRSYDVETDFNEKMNKISMLLIERDVSEQLRLKIKTFLGYKLELRIEERIDANEVLGLINRNLTEEIM